jgi:SNF2 family DNA or RNA helicase
MAQVDAWTLNTPGMEAGDRIELLSIERSADSMRLRPLGVRPDLRDIKLDAGDARGIQVDPSDGSLIVVTTSINTDVTWWLECMGHEQFRIVADRASSAMNFNGVDVDRDALQRMLNGYSASGLDGFRLSLAARRLASQPGFDQLISISLLRDLEPLDHQARTVKTVLHRMRGKAMLCDEVGLGKTVEAGLTLLELVSRGLVRSVLVLVPPSLIEQWKGEMLRKFGLELTGQDDAPSTARNRTGWCAAQRVIASIHTAKRDPYRAALLDRAWDMVIVDEAHHLRNRSTQAWKFASEIRKQFMLLLTATPVQNNLEELFNLVTLLEPGLLSTRKNFSKRYVDKKDQLAPKNVDELHKLLGEVMVRNRRSTVGVRFTNRFAKTFAVHFTPAEAELYDRLTSGVRTLLAATSAPEGRGGKSLNRMTLLTLQMALGSSAAAAAGMLENLLNRHDDLPPDLHAEWLDLHDRAAGIRQHAKLNRLSGLIDEFGDKLIVFTQFRATQDMIADYLRQNGRAVVVFHGGLSRLEKEAAVQRFRDDSLVLVSTESGSEGRNLQFCNGLCNYDLPWNPMRIEQRVGRLSRIGQNRDVHVFNLVAAGTIEQAVLHLLEAKLNMFELVIGEIDMILGNLDEEKEFSDMIADAWAESSGQDEFSARMELLGNRLLAAKLAYFRQKTQDEKLFGSQFAPDA